MATKKVITQNDLNIIYNKIQDNKKSEGKLLINELSFMIDTLDILKKDIKKNGVIEDFKQGKQEFKRESTALKSYNATIKNYNTTYNNLLKLLEDTQTLNNTDSTDKRNYTDDDIVIKDFWSWYNDNKHDIAVDYCKKYNEDINEVDSSNIDMYAKNRYNQENNTKITAGDLSYTMLDYEDFREWRSEDNND